MRLFAQLSWYFRREWRRYLGAVALLVIIAMLQLVPPKVVGIVVDGVTEQHFTTGQILMWIATMVLIAVVVYLLRYVWRVLLFGASYQLAVELREDYYRQLSRQHPEFYLRHRTGDLMARATNDVDRVVFAAGEGVLTLVDSLVMGCAVLIMMSTQISWQLTLFSLLPMPVMAIMIKRNGDALHERFKLAQAAFSSLNDRTQESLTSIRMIKAFGLEDRQSALFAADAEDTGKKNMRVARIDARFDPTINTRVHSLEGELLHRDDLPADVAELVLYQQWDTRASMHIFNDDGWFTGKEIPALLQAFVYSGFRYQIIDVKKMPLGSVTKICFCGDHDDLTRLQIQLYEALGERAHLCFSATDCLEVLPVGCNKGAALTVLTQHLGLSLRDCMAFGDAMNDREMLVSVGSGFIMGNAMPQLRAELPHLPVIGHCRNQAVSHYLTHWLDYPHLPYSPE